MNNADTNQMTQQFQSMFINPARSYAEMTLDYSEKLLATQQQAVKAYSDIAVGQARAMLEIKSAEDLQAFTESQQQAAKDLSERVKEDGQKVVDINRDFFQQGQNLAKEKAEEGQELTEQNVQKAQAETSKAADEASKPADAKANEAQATDTKSTKSK
ncbi:phasin family protein [Halomonas sp. TRM85114]|uniref:phasin family protein n=1 Tax=Halomonas jincaotanensis TaxID=2810616 RepID=UPI001BD5E161|nr:phasin family protein [Halomonas jincaotanensis]MBS9405629.1 phasin family protein [Halomonas jincaotanensis]